MRRFVWVTARFPRLFHQPSVHSEFHIIDAILCLCFFLVVFAWPPPNAIINNEIRLIARPPVCEWHRFIKHDVQTWCCFNMSLCTFFLFRCVVCTKPSNIQMLYHFIRAVVWHEIIRILSIQTTLFDCKLNGVDIFHMVWVRISFSCFCLY